MKSKEEILKDHIGDFHHYNLNPWTVNKNDILKAMEAYASQSQQEWVDVSEGLPEKYKQVIGYFPDGDEGGEKVATAHYNGNKLCSDFPNSTAHCFEATHWMILPPPPQDADKKK